MGLFSKNLPKKPITTLPSGYSEEKAVDEIYKSVFFMMAENKAEKDKLLNEITSPFVLKFSINYAQALVNEFKKRFPNDLMLLGDNEWHKIEATFFEGVYICTLIFYNNKKIRGETIQVPTGKQFDDFFAKETKKFDKSSDYADILIPPYLFKVIKSVSLLIFNELIKDEPFSKTSKEFQKSILIQYMHHSGGILAAYLIQDSFLD
jgi:hypothetical protein